jgi:uncharacterized protein
VSGLQLGWLASSQGKDVALVLIAVAVYAALAIALEEARRETVLPTGRRGADIDVAHEPGVRPQL